jgi:glucokinase
MSLAIGVDVGGTKTQLGWSTKRGGIIEMVKRPTLDCERDETIDMIADAVKELLARGTRLRQWASARPVSSRRAGSRRVRAESRLAEKEPVARQVEDRTGRPVVVENDANAAAWAEAKLGAGRGHEHVIMITIGTGIGAGLVLNGELYRGRFGMAGEPGHYRVVPDGRLCGCGNRGCWEQYASGSALVAEARDFARRSPGAALRLLQLSGGTPEGITGPEVTTAAREGDAAALRCFDIIGRWLGRGWQTWRRYSAPAASCLAAACRGRRSAARPDQGGVRKRPSPAAGTGRTLQSRSRSWPRGRNDRRG